jgi:hypothetical protein
MKEQQEWKITAMSDRKVVDLISTPLLLLILMLAASARATEVKGMSQSQHRSNPQISRSVQEFRVVTLKRQEKVSGVSFAKPEQRKGLAGDPEFASSDVDKRNWIIAAAERHGVPIDLGLRVAEVESNSDCYARGKQGELGPLQIKPKTARLLGYQGPEWALQSCGEGLEWGMRPPRASAALWWCMEAQSRALGEGKNHCFHEV